MNHFRPAFTLCLLSAYSILTGNANAVAVDLQCDHLRCEYRETPLGVDDQKPRLSWQVVSQTRGQLQSAYRVIVASSQEQLAQDSGDLWDTGKVDSNETIQIEYAGEPLSSGQQCFWKVKAWGVEGEETEWSPPAMWSMGLLEESAWKANYISFLDQSPVYKDPSGHFLPPASSYRKVFASAKPVKRATVYATALGIFDLELNGQSVSDDYFSPGWTDYRKRAYYKTYDVTEMLQDGDNVIGATVADGWYSGYVGFGLLVGIGTEQIGRYTYGKTPALMMQMEIEYQDGTTQRVVTDKSWKVSNDGPVLQADLLMGEFYDARQEQAGWSRVGFDDSSWQNTILASENGPQPATFYQFENPAAGEAPQIKGKPVDLGFKRPKLESFPGNPVVITEEIKPVSITKRGEGTYIFDFGQNFAGNVRMKVAGSSGDEIKLRYAEMLHTDGRMMTENLRKARSTDYYVCRGGGEEVYTPRFTFHGFQFVEVSNFPGKPTLDSITGLAIHSDTPLTSTFECSDSMVNQLFKNVVWTQRANFIDLPTDCPQRDERMGWTGDAQAYVATAAYNGDVAAFFTKWNRELMESQRPSGAFPGYAPFPFQHGWDFGSAWADAGIICPWTIWQSYGDTRMIDRCWEPMTRFMDWRNETSVDDLGITHGNAWGDWLSQGEVTPLDFVDTVYYAISTGMMAEMAAATGRDEEAKEYSDQLARTKAAFVKRYVADDGSINVPTQTAHALAIYADLVPEELREKTGQHLATMLEDNGNHMATGFLGTRPLLPALSATNQNDLAAFLLQSREFPSWGYEIDQGATSIWERWDSYTKQDGFGRHNAAMNSFSHYAFGAVCEWMFRTLAGIESDGVGYREITIKPHPPSPESNSIHAPIDWVKASYDSIRGTIKSDWRIRDSQFELNVSIPANTTAKVYLPTSDVNRITESGQPIAGNPHVKVLSSDASHSVLAVASGDYQFVAPSSLAPAKVALKTSKAKDKLLNPEKLDLTDAEKVAHWDFSSADDIAKWEKKNATIEVRDGKTFVIAAGIDSQVIAEVPSSPAGSLVVELRAMPSKGSDSQLFWAGPSKLFSAGKQTRRQLRPTDQINSYLFKIDTAQPLRKLRFDPFAQYDEHANKGEMQIESISIYRTNEKRENEPSAATEATTPENAVGDKALPNILLFLSEDQGAHLSRLGTAGLQTPHIDELARRGTYFSNAFVVYSVCSASKAAMYTGLHSHTNGILNNTYNFHKPASQVTASEREMELSRTNRIRDQFLTLTEILKANGYYQGVTHKLHVLPNEKFPYDEFLGEDQASANQFLRRASEQDQPWFLMVNMPYSHRPYPNSDKKPIRVNPADVQLPSYLPDTPLVRQDWAEYLSGIEKVDAVVGRTMKALTSLKQDDNTIVIYLSDHGPTFPHGKMTLYDLGLRIPMIVSGPGISPQTSDVLVSELDVLPTILDLISSNSNQDLKIPGSDQANKLPYPVHGKSLKNIVTGQSGAKGHEYIFAQISNRGPLPNDGIQERSVFDGRWKLIYRENVERRWRQVNDDTRMFKTWGNRSYAETIRVKDQFPEAYRVLREMDPQTLDGEVPPLELYDLKEDPDEMNNLVAHLESEEHVTRLMTALKDWVAETNDTAVNLN